MDLNNMRDYMGLGLIENVEAGIINTIAEAISPEMMYNESIHWNIGEINPRSNDSANNMIISRRTT